MAIIYASRAKFSIEGVASKYFLVGQNNLLSISLHEVFVNQPVIALNYTPTAISTVAQTKDISLVFEHTFTNSDQTLNFYSLPSNVANIQAILSSITGTPIALLSGLFYKESHIVYSNSGAPVRRNVVFGALDKNELGV